MTKTIAIFCLLLYASITFDSHASYKKVVRVGVHNNPPLCSIDSSNEAQGIFIDIIKLVADNNNWELEYHAYNFADAIEALHYGRLDLVPTVAYSAEREQTLQFCQETIFTNWGVIYTTKYSQIENIPDLNNKRLGLEKGDIHTAAFIKLLDDFNVNANIVWCSGPNDIFNKLRNKEIDAGSVNKVFGYRQNIDHQLNATSILFNPVNVKFAGGPLSRDLLNQIDSDLAELKSNDPEHFEAIINQRSYPSSDQSSPQWIFYLILTLIGLSFVLIIVLMILKSSVQTKSKHLHNEKLQRLNNEKTIKQLEHEKTLILNSIDEQVVFMDNEYRIVWANDAFKKASKKPFNEVLGKKCYEMYFNLNHPCEHCNYEKCQITNRTESMEYYNEKSGQYFMAKTHPVYDQEHRPIGFVEILSNITDKKNNEKELIAAKERAEQSDYLKSTFLANMSHEIRTPMNAIIGFSELLEDNTLTNDEKQTYVGIIQSNGQQLLKLISDILIFSQIESGHIEMQYSNFIVTDFLDGIYRQFKSDTQKHNGQIDVELEVKGIPQNFMIDSDTVRLKQVVYNLLTNAIKFTEKGSVTLGAHIKEDHLIISVRDTGIGIPKEQHADIFKRFSQVENNKVRKAAGSGLGLTIAQDLISQLGGEISLDSTLNIGSTFYVSHPIKKINISEQDKLLEGVTSIHKN